MFFLIHYARVVHAIRRFLSRKGLLEPLNRRATVSNGWLWFRSLFSVLDFHDFITLETPWWTLASGRQVRNFLRQSQSARALEWGSGASTVWLAALCREVVSIESDSYWAQMVRAAVGEGVEILTPPIPVGTEPHSIRSKRWGFRHLDFQHYVNAIDKTEGQFDLIVVDGRAREACFDKALQRLAPGGIILFDNTNRRRYRRALQAHRAEIVVSRNIGLTPIVPWPTETSIVSLLESDSYAANSTTPDRVPTS